MNSTRIQSTPIFPDLTLSFQIMSHFSVRVIYENGKPASDIGVMIDYGWLGGTDEKRTHSDGWVKFYNYENKSGTIWVHGHNKGNHCLAAERTYSFII